MSAVMKEAFVGLVGLFCYVVVVLGKTDDVGLIDAAGPMDGLMRAAVEGRYDGAAMTSSLEGIESVRAATGRVRTDLSLWINEVGFLPESEGGGLSFLEIAGTEFDNFLITEVYNASGNVIGVQYGDSTVYPPSGKPGFFFVRPIFIRPDILGDRTDAVALRVVCASAFFRRLSDVGFVKWTDDNFTLQDSFLGKPPPPTKIRPIVPLGKEPFGTGLALYGRGATVDDFRGYRQVVYTSAKQSPGLNPKQKINTLCYQSTKTTAAFKGKRCFELGPSCEGLNVGKVCVDIIEGTKQQCFKATFTYGDGFLGKSASFGAFKKCLKHLAPRTNQAMTSPDDPPSPSQTLLVCFNEVEFGRPWWREFIPYKHSQVKKCCNLRRCLNMKAEVVDSDGKEFSVAATDYYSCKGTSGDCKVSTKCVKTPEPTPTPYGVWINEILFNPAANDTDNSTTVRAVEIAGYDWGKGLQVYYFDGEGNLVDKSDRFSSFLQPPNGQIDFATLNSNPFPPTGVDAKALALIRAFTQDGIDLTEVIEFVTWKGGPYPDVKPILVGPHETARLRAFPLGLRPRSILPAKFGPFNVRPGGTALIKVGTGSSVLDFDVKQIVNENTDPVPAGLNPGQTVTLPPQ